MRRLIVALVLIGFVGAAAFWLLTTPQTIAATELPAHTPDVKNGEYMFYAGGCASCHAAPVGDKCDNPKYQDKFVLGGGRCLRTPFGTFNIPNISPDPNAGIGKWTDLQFANAMMRGVGPDGSHYYPSFPYTSYQRMRYEDVLDLKAFLLTLKPVAVKAPGHELSFPFNIRRGMGVWKRLYMDGKQFTPDPNAPAEINRGAYLIEGPGHCEQCHTSRNLIGGLKASKKLAGAPNPDGRGIIPNITPDKQGIGDWSKEDIAYLLETGFKPDFDVVGGNMASVQTNTAKLTPEDRQAIAAYLKSLPPLPSAVQKPKSKAKPADDAEQSEAAPPKDAGAPKEEQSGSSY